MWRDFGATWFRLAQRELSCGDFAEICRNFDLFTATLRYLAQRESLWRNMKLAIAMLGCLAQLPSQPSGSQLFRAVQFAQLSIEGAQR
jgi:hypothetical protein